MVRILDTIWNGPEESGGIYGETSVPTPGGL